MALYILVHHNHDPNQPWKNGWLDLHATDPSFLDHIYTRPVLALACESERLAGNRVFIHRCSFRHANRVVCASAKVASVDLTLSKVTFTDHILVGALPPIQANQGQISYYA